MKLNALEEHNELITQKELLTTLIDSTPDIICFKDGAGKWLRANKADLELFQLENVDYFGKKDSELAQYSEFYYDAFMACEESDEIAWKNKGISRGEEVIPKPDGTSKVYDVIKVPLFNEDDSRKGLVVLGRDITELRGSEKERLELERQVQHAQKLESLGILAGGIAHDFNNILTAILGNADLALLNMSKVAPGRKNLEEILTATRRGADLANQMLAYSGKGKFIIEKIILSEIVQEMSHLLEVSISKKAVLKYNFSDHSAYIEGDATQIRQVIMNLLTNASDAIGDKSGIISISTGIMDCDQSYLKDIYIKERIPTGTYAYIEVADTGSGMDEETKQKLFDPFFTTKFTGRGLGLSAVLGIVRGHKGAIKIYSELKRGTTIKVLFPVSKMAFENNHDSLKNRYENSLSGTALFVDDEESIRSVTRQMLEQFGMKVFTAGNGVEALKIYKSRPKDIDLVILDLTMPHKGGEETFRELRQINPDIKVIMSSGYNEQEVTQRFVGKGICGFIQKPFQLDKLLKSLKDIL